MAAAIRFICKLDGQVRLPAWVGSTPTCPKCADTLAVEDGSGRIDGKPITWTGRP